MSRHRLSGQMQWFTATVSTTLVLVLLGLVVLFGLVATQLSRDVRENLTVTLLLDDDLDTPEAESFRQKLSKKPYVRALALISKEQVLKEQTEAMGSDPSEFLGGENPFTTAIEMNVMADYACTDSLIWIARELRERWEVADVVYQTDLVNNLNHNLRKVTIVLSVLAVLLLIISIVLINNTVRLNVYAQRFQIHTMRLVGASWHFIRWPFLKRSLGIGLTSAFVAGGLLVGGTWYLLKHDPGMSAFITPLTIGIVLATVLVSGLLLTLICTAASVNHFLRMREEEMYR